MDEKAFTWTHELAERLLEIRFSNDWLFKKYKQPWHQFHKLLLENGFPKHMTISHVRKKYGYLYDMYKIAKKTKNKTWPYYELFNEHYSKAKITDVRYESWSIKWRLKLVTCVTEAKAQKIEYQDMWRTVEKALRSLNLPLDCCIQDIKGLWHHLTVTFNRKHRLLMKKGVQVDWPLYEPLLQYFHTHDPDYMVRLETEPALCGVREKKVSDNYFRKDKHIDIGDDDDFQWSKHTTESFIQIRLQHDWLFRERKWAWNDLCAIMINEYGFPKSVMGRDLSKKWAGTFADYQKAKATNNKSWVWYTLFELYLGDGKLSFNPTIGWQEEWVRNFISARTDLEYLFLDKNLRKSAWREVEKRLRTVGLPLDHSLLDLPEIWAYLLKTFYWKDKFAKKGMLTEQWPYYDALARYEEIKVKTQIERRTAQKINIKRQKKDDYEKKVDDFHFDDDDYEDDMKLFDLKQKLELVKPKMEILEGNSCRSCSGEGGCVNIYDQRDGDGFSLADKLKMIGDVQVDPTDGYPSQMCFACLRDLENAYKFRRRCQEVDKTYRNSDQAIRANKIKTEITVEERNRDESMDLDSMGDLIIDNDYDQVQEKKPLVKKKVPQIIRRKKKRVKKEKYEYIQMCEICGKTTKNLKHHLDAHATGKFYSCDMCDKKFKFKGGLIVHKAIHEPTPRKTCEVCGKSFHIMAQYRRHFVYHANERRFSCDTCGKRFNTIDILRVHMRMHTDERPFSCYECGKTFRTAGCVSRHKRIVHKPRKIQYVE